MTRNVLMIAFYYPPMTGSSGVQRTLKFSRYLREFGWHPTIVSAHPRVYMQTSDDLLADVPPDVSVKRAFCLDTAKHLSVAGRYPRFLAWPDRWISWWLGAVPSALAAVRRLKPDILWSTYPIATAHLVGLTVHKATRLPWVADFRDPMYDEDYPVDANVRRMYRWIDKRAAENAQRSVFTTPGTLRTYAERYPAVDAERWVCIPNGFDDEDMARVRAQCGDSRPSAGVVRLLHSGVIYPEERDPTQLFSMFL